MKPRSDLFNLNVSDLVILDLLLDQPNLSAVARQLGQTQSSISHTLRRLRDMFQDPLLVRMGTSLRPTPFAEQMQPRLRHALEALGNLSTVAEPSAIKRRFSIGGTDYAEQVVLPRLLPHLSSVAPQLSLDFVFVGDRIETELQAGNLDMAILGYHRTVGGLLARILLEDRYVCVTAKAHPWDGRAPSLDEYLSARHCEVRPRGYLGHRIDEHIPDKAGTRAIALTFASFLSALHTVASTDLVAVIPGSLARQAARTMPLHVCDLPFEMPPFKLTLVFPEIYQRDREHAFLRELVVSTMKKSHS